MYVISVLIRIVFWSFRLPLLRVTHTCSHYVIVLEYISLYLMAEWKLLCVINKNSNNNNDDGNRIVYQTWKSDRERVPLHVHSFSHIPMHFFCMCKRLWFTLRQEAQSLFLYLTLTGPFTLTLDQMCGPRMNVQREQNDLVAVGVVVVVTVAADDRRT